MTVKTPIILIAHCGVDADPDFVATAVANSSAFSQTRVTASGTELRHTLKSLVTDVDGTDDNAGPTPHIVVTPMTSGRNLTLIADTAKTCRWFKHNHTNVRIALAPPPLNNTTTLASLRATLRRETSPNDIAVISSAAINPFADAELFRIARLAWTHSSGADVVVAFDDVYPSVSEALEPHLAAFGDTSLRPTRRSAVIRADLQTAANQKPLLSSTALSAAISQSVKTAQHLLQSHDDDGIKAALLADHEHGYAHSHVNTDGDFDHRHHHHHHHHVSADTHAEFDLGSIDADATE